MAFCRKCGAELKAEDKFCPACGEKVEGDITPVQQVNPVVNEDFVSPKSRLACTLMAWIGGPLFIHNFYTGRVGQGIFKALLFIVGYIMDIVGLAIMEEVDEVIGIPVTLIGAVLVFVMLIISLVEAIKCTKGTYTDSTGKIISVWIHD